jgi:hypothetical protein
VLNKEARGYLASNRSTFDLIQVPPMGASGASGAGVHATAESYLYTIEAFSAMLDRLRQAGVLSVTRWVRTPPRDGLRIFDTAISSLRSRGLDPSPRLAMIRNLATVTVLIFLKPITPEEAQVIRTFCRQRGFDLGYLPDMKESEADQYQILDRPYYFEAAQALLGPRREAYLRNYIFDVRAATDDRPYFHHFLKWRNLPRLREQLGGLSPAFFEVGYLMLLAALVQTLLLAAALILLPLAPGRRLLRSIPRKAPTLAYFLLLGVGFMLLEMGFLQKLILYLADPIYSAAAVIGGFLVFSGLGSQLSSYWPGRLQQIVLLAASAVVCLGGAYLFGMDHWLTLTQGKSQLVKFVIAAATIAPLAFAMGHLFPTGLRQVGTSSPALVPWAWAVNGFASVVATVAAPLLAMNVGFSRLVVMAIGCYALAGVVFRLTHPQPCHKI